MKKVSKKHISLINALLLGLVSALSLAAITVPSARAAAMLPAEQCDAEAGSEYDLQRNFSFRPVATEDIRIGVALSACREAYKQGAEPRQTFQLARVLYKAGQRSQAMAMLKAASEEGHAIAMVNYGVMLDENGNHEAAFTLFEKAAATGNILAAYNLGVAYRDGVGTKVDAPMAIQWFERASLAKDDIAAFNLAVMLDEGKLVREDNAKAAKLYRIAADRGNIDAMVNLALMLRTGEGVQRDLSAARELLTKAAIAGDEFAVASLQAQPADTTDVAMIDDTVTSAIAADGASAPVLQKTARLK
ncbi:TPR repeat protein [Pararhizobium capsulatum DSM 1112]|uniref:TPR repeat protein n=1 Tax=Pararhizobium capsulatum DSM 1112 TaxID=1121113 RepID=A0ABU0BKM7_9HYPH|nr:tetratricopeptide repeat protein [Pararhizobium capsulatum]MDQ0318799.1 TPR repeat protein [Pararhizobium capsulatum DSM 1112]